MESILMVNIFTIIFKNSQILSHIRKTNASFTDALSQGTF